jgi:hypothetical protein
MKIHLFKKHSSHGGEWWHLGFSKATQDEYDRFQDVAYQEAEIQNKDIRLLNHNFDPYPDKILEYRSGSESAILEHAEWVATMLQAELVLDPI